MDASQLTVTSSDLIVASQLIVTASEFIDVKLDQPQKGHLLVALRSGITDTRQGTEEEVLRIFFQKASPPLRLSIVDLLVYDVLAKYQVPSVRQRRSFPLLLSQAEIISDPHERGILRATKAGLHKKHDGNDRKLETLKKAFVGSGTAENSLLRRLVLADQVVPLLLKLLDNRDRHQVHPPPLYDCPLPLVL